VESRSIDLVLAEAMERYERDLPLSKSHVAQILMVSERTVERLFTGSGRTARGGVVWYAREDVEAKWRKSTDQRRDGIATRPRRGGSSHSSIGAVGGSSSTFKSPGTEESVRPLREKVEKMLGGRRSRSSKASKED